MISDLLGIQVDKDNTTIGPVQNANLEHPAELERQIVEFMKYRGPIDISKNIVSRFRKIVKKTKNVSKELNNTRKKLMEKQLMNVDYKIKTEDEYGFIPINTVAACCRCSNLLTCSNCRCIYT